MTSHVTLQRALLLKQPPKLNPVEISQNSLAEPLTLGCPQLTLLSSQPDPTSHHPLQLHICSNSAPKLICKYAENFTELNASAAV